MTSVPRLPSRPASPRENRHRPAAFALALCLLAWVALVRANAGSDWDQALPALELRQVAISAASLESAWKQFSTRHLVRSVLLSSRAGAFSGAFFFKADRCRVRDVLDALAAAYPGMTWTADPETHVLWLHPSSLAWDAVLPQAVRIPRAFCAIPMQTGLLQPLRSAPGLRVVPATWGTAFTNTFDYAVDVAAGSYRLRDLLSLACKAHPSKTFAVRSTGGAVSVTAVNLVPEKLAAPPAGALSWWEARLGPIQRRRVPTESDLRRELSSPDPERRAAARAYLEAVLGQIDVDALLARAATVRETVWTAVGIASVLVRHRGVTEVACAKRLAATLDGPLAGRRGSLSLLASLQLLQLTGDAAHLRDDAQLSAAELAAVADDAIRLANLSEPVRGVLAARLRLATGGDLVARCVGGQSGTASPWPAAVQYAPLEP